MRSSRGHSRRAISGGKRALNGCGEDAVFVCLFDGGSCGDLISRRFRGTAALLTCDRFESEDYRVPKTRIVAPVGSCGTPIENAGSYHAKFILDRNEDSLDAWVD